jgi:hypothetical protein
MHRSLAHAAFMKHPTILAALASTSLLFLPACKEKSSTPPPSKMEKEAAPAAESAKKTVDKAAEKGAEKAADALNKQP